MYYLPAFSQLAFDDPHFAFHGVPGRIDSVTFYIGAGIHQFAFIFRSEMEHTLQIPK